MITIGRYKTRSGKVAEVNRRFETSNGDPFCWVGTVSGCIESWDDRGLFYGNGRRSSLDLVERLPNDQPLPADNRIKRALHVLRDACDESEESSDGWDLVRHAIKILEG